MNKGTNKRQGSAFEQEIKERCERYAMERVAYLEKVDPPVLMAGPRMILKRNPFPDFVGTWRMRGGVMLAIEAKTTKDHKLVISKATKGSGLRLNQIKLLLQWGAYGAAVCVLWKRVDINRVAVLSEVMLHQLLSERSTSLSWERLPAACVMARLEFLQCLERLTWPEYTSMVAQLRELTPG